MVIPQVVGHRRVAGRSLKGRNGLLARRLDTRAIPSRGHAPGSVSLAVGPCRMLRAARGEAGYPALLAWRCSAIHCPSGYPPPTVRQSSGVMTV